jgi:choloylglycine hydrolase
MIITRSKRWLTGTIAAFMMMGPAVSHACTSFLLPGSDGGFVYGRTLEFGVDIQSRGIAIARNYAMQGTGVEGKPNTGLKWTTKYAAIGSAALGLPILVDGFNEKGLAGGMLYAPGITEYQEVAPAESAQSIASYEMLVYALTNFATVDQAREGFKKIKVNRSPQKAFKGVVQLHLTLHDASGQSIVIEYIGGELQISDNPTSVLTNAPHFNWHINNLGNFTGISTKQPGSIKVGPSSIGPWSTGYGTLGIPGDLSSPSRFVRAFFMKLNAPTNLTTEQQVATAFHFLNNFDLPPGLIDLSSGGFGGGGGGYEMTYWSAVSDLKNMIFYIRTHGNPTVQTIEMSKLDLDAKEIQYFDFSEQWTVKALN